MCDVSWCRHRYIAVRSLPEDGSEFSSTKYYTGQIFVKHLSTLIANYYLLQWCSLSVQIESAQAGGEHWYKMLATRLRKFEVYKHYFHCSAQNVTFRWRFLHCSLINAIHLKCSVTLAHVNNAEPQRTILASKMLVCFNFVQLGLFFRR